eukprot:189562-Hanusia_phi.AAC.1
MKSGPGQFDLNCPSPITDSVTRQREPRNLTCRTPVAYDPQRKLRNGTPGSGIPEPYRTVRYRVLSMMPGYPPAAGPAA